MMKKILAVLLVLAMALSFAACAGKDKEENSGSKIEVNTGDKTEEKNFKVGTIEGNVYTSEVANIKFTKDDIWVFLDDDAIEVLTGLVQDMTDDKTVEKAMEDGASVFDMYAMSTDGSGNSVNVTVSNLGALYGSVLTEEVYAGMVKEQIKTSFDSMGAKNLNIDTASFEIGGEKHGGIHCTVEIQGVGMFENMICIKAGRYMYNITCAASSEAGLDACMAMLSAK